MRVGPGLLDHLQIWIDSSSVLPFFSQGKRALLRSTALILT